MSRVGEDVARTMWGSGRRSGADVSKDIGMRTGPRQDDGETQ